MRPSYGSQGSWCQYYETISKKLSRVLRYERHRQGLPTDPEGYVSLADLCTLEMFRKDNETDILKAARDSHGRQGPRFNVDSSGPRIKAMYTHDDKYPGGVHPTQRRNTHYNDSYGGKGYGGKGQRGPVLPPPDEPPPPRDGYASGSGSREQAHTSSSQSQSSRAPASGPPPQQDRPDRDPLWIPGSDAWANSRNRDQRGSTPNGHREQPASTSSSSTSRGGPSSSSGNGAAPSSASTAHSSDHAQNGRTQEKPASEGAGQCAQAPRRQGQQQSEQNITEVYNMEWNNPEEVPWTRGRNPSTVGRKNDEAGSEDDNPTPRATEAEPERESPRRADRDPYAWKDQVKDNRSIRGSGKTTEEPERREETHRQQPISQEAYEEQYGANGAAMAVEMGIAVPTPAVQVAESQDLPHQAREEVQEEAKGDVSQQSTAASAEVEVEVAEEVEAEAEDEEEEDEEESTGPEKDWERYLDEAGKPWFWRSSTQEFFIVETASESGWAKYTDPVQGHYWLHESGTRAFFMKDVKV